MTKDPKIICFNRYSNRSDSRLSKWHADKFRPKLCKFLCKQFVLFGIVCQPIIVRIANSSMAAIVGHWCGVNAKYSIYVTASSTTVVITNVVRVCTTVCSGLNSLKAQSSSFSVKERAFC